jgi:hypothetical protein
MTAMARILITSGFASTAALWGGRFLGLATENSFQPADETAGFLCGLGLWRATLVGCIRTRLECPVVATWLAWFETARLARVTSAFARLPWFARLVGPAAFATFTPLPTGLKCLPFIGTSPGFRLAGWRRVGFPAQRCTTGILGRQDVELGLRGRWRG